MPTYVYACKSCGNQFEKYQSFSEDSLLTCPECHQDALRKVFNSVGIVFKGSGFYSTDSTASSATSTSSSSAADASGKVSAPAAESSTSSASSSSTAAPAAAAGA
ncbi:FmdB family zinc ribbon protein [Brachybacterium phenoliresistens]|uniref:FmdB family transcriptional regulator n=1 Tax=Brachybacterium phenoliresistens TaxID=396014 RepID=Z9JS06_9MICO|nr:zinc ribbon domain-containing protein [Brachybacterium phenoliresistens]EWS80571.1 FmdB family transcriptional regulator [Brachybacterium phenoliresistens]